MRVLIRVQVTRPGSYVADEVRMHSSVASMARMSVFVYTHFASRNYLELTAACVRALVHANEGLWRALCGVQRWHSNQSLLQRVQTSRKHATR
jgi:hypothetical protein